MHPNCIAVFAFDRSSAHEGFAENSLNVNNMNLNPGGKQRKLHNTVIPLNNLGPAPGEEDTHSQTQWMSFPDDHDDLKLRGQPKGMRVVLQERKSIWDKFTASRKEHHMKLVGKCASCTKSQVRKDAELVMCMARLEAVSRAKPGPNRPGQAGPKWRPHNGFGLAWGPGKPEPGSQATAFAS
jgi:hypothetical protein